MLASASGVYAIRRRGDRAVEYVGESHTGRLWKTLQRHFQEGGGSFEDRSEYVRTSPAEYDAAAWITSKGAREKKRGDQGALDLQAALIERYAPTENRDDGRAYGPCPHGCSSWRCARAHLVPDVVRPGEAPAPDDDFPFGANEEPAEPAGAFDDLIAANPPARGGGMLPPNVPVERRAEMRTPSLFTGRTKLEEEGAKARRDWKGEADRLGRELAACRSAVGPPAVAAPPPPERPAPKRPEGFGELDAKGQAAMFKFKNPADPLGLEATIDMGQPMAGLPPRGARLHTSELFKDNNGRTWFEFRDKKVARWAPKLIEAARVQLTMRGIFYPSATSSSAEWAHWWLELARALPNLPASLQGPWRGGQYYVEDAEGALIAETGGGLETSTLEASARMQRIAGATLAALGTLATFSTYAKQKKGLHPRDCTREIARLSKQSDSLALRTDPADRAKHRKLEAKIGILSLLVNEAEGAAPVEAPPALPPRLAIRDSRHVVSIVDAGPAHSLAVGEAPFSADDSRVIHALSLGWIRREPARGRWPERWVVTGAGSHALGTFDSDDPSFRDDAIDAGNEARRKKKAASSAAKPAGYGDEERGKKKAGQLRMFNPPARGKKRSTRAGLVVLGALVSIVYKPAGSNDAQPDPKTMRIPGAALAYEKKRGGRLVIVHAPRATGAAASSAARAEYARTHWGEPGRGQSLEGEILAGRDGVRRVGAVLQITYRTRKGASGKLVDYYHDFGEGSRRRLVLPLLESAKIGARTLYRLAGGSYTVERRGIVG